MNISASIAVFPSPLTNLLRRCKKAIKPAVLLFIASLIAVTGCRKEETEPTVAAEQIKLFEKGKGLRLPEQTCQMIGVETIEVAERKFIRTLEVNAQVYEKTAQGLARAVATFSEENAKVFKPGAKVMLLGLKGDSNPVSGTLIRRENFGTQAEALLEFSNTDGRLEVGSFVRIQFTTDQAHTALAVPEGSVIHSAEGPFVYAVNGAHFTRTPVKTGITSDDYTEILEGLYAGDSIASKATGSMWMIELYALKGGTPCCPVPKKTGRN